MAINWRNIDAPSFGAANLLLQSGGNRIGEGIQSLQNLAAQQGRNAQANLDEASQKNTEAVINQISSIGSMEDYDNALQQGLYNAENLQKQYGNNVDITAVRNALMQRDNQIAQDETDRFNYDTTVQKRADSPLINQFSQDAIKATSVDGVDALMDSVSSSPLSEEGKTAALQTLQSRKQDILDQKYQEIQRGRESWRFAQDVEADQRSDEAYFLSQYDEKGKLKNQTDMQHYQNQLAGLDKKYNIPENYDDVIASGTATDAVSQFVSGLDNEDVAVNDVNTALLEGLKKETYTDPNGREYAYQQLPKWVVSQALKEITLKDKADFWSTDFGRRDLSTSQMNQINKSIKANLATYSKITSDKALRDAEALKLNAELYNAQTSELERVNRGREAFRNPKRNH